MKAASLLLIFFFSRVVSQTPPAVCGCHPCKQITEGPHVGSYNLVEDAGVGRCGSSCLYRKNNDDSMYCMCEPGDLEVQICRAPLLDSWLLAPGSNPNGLPKLVMGMYILLADDTAASHYHTDSDWQPLLHQYQQEGSNVLFFTFINPATMDVPISFQNLAATKGKGTDGAVPATTRIIFAIGGYGYSLNPNPWEWLTSQDKAEAMAERVAKWQDDYKIDGIDLDIETGAGEQSVAGHNMVHFIRKLKALKPGLLVSLATYGYQPTYGYPQISAENDVINESWNVDGMSNGLADSINIMVFKGTQALMYVKNFAEGTSRWPGFPIHVNVPRKQILVGCKGSASADTIDKLAKDSVSHDLLGIMVWFCSVRGGLVYGPGWDCSGSQESMDGYVAAMKYFRNTP